MAFLLSCATVKAVNSRFLSRCRTGNSLALIWQRPAAAVCNACASFCASGTISSTIAHRSSTVPSSPPAAPRLPAIPGLLLPVEGNYAAGVPGGRLFPSRTF